MDNQGLVMDVSRFYCILKGRCQGDALELRKGSGLEM